MSITRRKFLIRTFRTAAAAAIGSSAISGCKGISVAKRSLDETVRRDYYEKLTRGWDVKGKRILDSKHFHDMRAVLRRVVLEQKRFLPGTRPYSMMLKILGYSTQEEQKVILTLPLIAPGLLNIYKKPRYEDGTFFNLLPVEKPSRNWKE